MVSGTLTIYSASAGSGKTYKLTSIYLSKLFGSKTGFRKILAVTFTNKAATDMKRKIISQLYDLARGANPSLARSISLSSGKTEEAIQLESGEILSYILHDYSRFFVGTIDSFFQRVLKSFTREIGLQHGYTIELDHSLILSDAVDDTLADTVNDPELMNWIMEDARNRIDEGRNWNIRNDIMSLAEEIFREKFRLITPEERAKLRDRDYLKEYLVELKSIRSLFGNKLKEYAVICFEILDRHNVMPEMFLRGNRGGVPSFLGMMKKGVQGVWKPPNATVSQSLGNPPVWTSKAGIAPELQAALEDDFEEIFRESLEYYNNGYAEANTAGLIMSNIYVLGILSDILGNVHKITTSDNRFLLSDAGELLYLIIGNDQTPFIYEKTGNHFEHFMIDEFQDTSLIQWNNFRPLIENSMAEGNENLIVGDVKQSIYRWRNSDWTIFESLLKMADNKRLFLKKLEQNWRSRSNIITFNNTVFSVLPALLDSDEDFGSNGSGLLQDIYSDVLQHDHSEKNGGLVRIEFLKETDDKNFHEEALVRLSTLLEEIQDNGYSGSDIGILVRTNSEGAMVLSYMLDYQDSLSDEKRTSYNFNIISNDSLLLSECPAVKFILSVLGTVNNPGDQLAKAAMLKNWYLADGRDSKSLSYHDIDNELDKHLPRGYRDFLDMIRQFPVFELVENVIQFFGLGDHSENTAYLNTLQDCILELSENQSTDISTFMEWWNSAGVKKSTILTDQQDSIRLMTIHKSKGLEFKVVIIPFLSWNIGHGRKNPTLWITPVSAPFNRLPIVPVKYKIDLRYSYFAEDYYSETYSSIVDNLNLLYVSFTRAIDSLYAFCPEKSQKTSVGNALTSVFSSEPPSVGDKPVEDLRRFFDMESAILLYGNKTVSVSTGAKTGESMPSPANYYVFRDMGRLHLKLDGQEWILRNEENESRINYGLMMHEIFQEIITFDDVSLSVNRMVLEGKIPASQREEMIERINRIITNPEVADWFKPGIMVMNERDIIAPDGSIKRPDRVMIDGNKVTIVDFKFGIEKEGYVAQLLNYGKLVRNMGYSDLEMFLWYVDKNKVVEI